MNSGDWGGIMFSPDNGNTWSMIDSFPVNYYVTDILETDSSGSLIVAAQSNLYDRNDGGIWQKSGSSKSVFQRVSNQPTFTFTNLKDKIIATHPRDPQNSVSSSSDGGATWTDMGQLPWTKDAVPFYTCATTLVDGTLVVAGLTRSPGLPNNTNSQFFIMNNEDTQKDTGNWIHFNQPTSMDEDAMPKDRMAVLGDPTENGIMYVAGNAGALAWRVNVTSGDWTQMWDKPDVLDGSVPHGDCRNYAWDSDYGNGRLLLVSDGGIFSRIQPRAPGGKWVSLNGDYASMELLTAHYAPREARFVAGAQDNCAQVTINNAKPSDQAIGFVEGDGTVTLIDNVANPARLFGTTQFLGVGTVFIDPSTTTVKVLDDDDDDDCGGLCFAQGDQFIGVPLSKYFPRPSSFPFFVEPYALNSQDPTSLVFWANGTGSGVAGYEESGFYAFHIPHDGVSSKEDIKPPKLLLRTSGFYILNFISGGYTNNIKDPSLIVAMSNTNL